MKVAGIQIHSGPDQKRNIDRAMEMAEVAAEKGARIICYPELFLTPWFPKEEDRSCFAWAVDATDGILERVKQVSERTGAVLIIPFFESSGGNYYNSAAVIDGGKLLGVYRKIHLPDLRNYHEHFYFSSGNTGFPVFETSHGRIGIQICWDNLFPEGTRILALKGAEIVFAPTAASRNTHTLWERAISANAFANNLYIFRINRVGEDGGLSFYGRSFCVDPWGDMVSELAANKDAIVLADINRDERNAALDTWGFLRHRRPGQYGELLQEQGPSSS